MSRKLTRQDVQEILAILDNSHFDDLKIETDDFKIALRRNGAGSSQPAAAVPSASSEPTRGIMTGAVPEQRRESASAPPENSIEITAPMFGTFFRSPKPGADPYVAVGAKVRSNTTIGIIEVMKLMNPVVAGVEGEILDIPVADGDVVEFGQTLMRVRLDQ